MPSELWYFVLDRLNQQYSTKLGTPVTMLSGAQGGVVFPIPGGKFSPGWGAARKGHTHQGVDIFAPMGTPIYAPMDGKIQNTSGDLSGLAVRFFDSNGNKYFMGHLSGQSGPNRAVKAGEVIGYVGNTGNAKGTSPHVHFQYHPNGERAVDPYNLLTTWQGGAQTVDYKKEYGPASLGVPYSSQIIAASQKQGVPIQVLAGLLNAESGFNPRSRSGAGAVGIAQFMPGTWKGLPKEFSSGSPLDPNLAIQASAYYLKQQYNNFGSWELALAAYNAGAGNVKKYGGIPPFKETQNYVKKVMGYKLPQGSGYDVDQSRASRSFGYSYSGGSNEETTYLANVARAGIKKDLFLETQQRQRQQRELTDQYNLIQYQKEHEKRRQKELKREEELLNKRRVIPSRGGNYA